MPSSSAAVAVNVTAPLYQPLAGTGVAAVSVTAGAGPTGQLDDALGVRGDQEGRLVNWASYDGARNPGDTLDDGQLLEC